MGTKELLTTDARDAVERLTNNAEAFAATYDGQHATVTLDVAVTVRSEGDVATQTASFDAAINRDGGWS